jgi:ribose 5-phosphate isomerase B
MKIYLAADHGGYELKQALITYVAELGHEAVDCGNTTFDKDDNFPDFVLKAAEQVSQNPDARGIVIGGSGQGEAMAANRVPDVRATVFYGPMKAVAAVDVTGRTSDDPYEIIRLGRQHNNSNVLAFGARFVTPDDAKTALKLWLETEFSGQDRYARRIDQIEAYTRKRL